MDGHKRVKPSVAFNDEVASTTVKMATANSSQGIH